MTDDNLPHHIKMDIDDAIRFILPLIDYTKQYMDSDGMVEGNALCEYLVNIPDKDHARVLLSALQIVGSFTMWAHLQLVPAIADKYGVHPPQDLSANPNPFGGPTIIMLDGEDLRHLFDDMEDA